MIDRDAFLATVRRYRQDGWRLAIINATSVLPSDDLPAGAFDVTWSFATDAAFEHIRERILPGQPVPSISDLYGGAFLYENEMRELFGIDVTGIAVDLRGELYKTASKVPFSPAAIRARLEASGRSATPAKHDATAKPAPKPATPRPAEGAAAPSTGASRLETPVSDGPEEPTKPSAAPETASAPEATSDASAGVRRVEDKADASTRTSAHETCVSEGAERPTQSSTAPQRPSESKP